MDEEAAWQVIHQERAALGELLRTLTPEQWEHPSLCRGWSVRDVAAHVIAWPDTTLRQALAIGLRARGNFNRMIHDEAQRRSSRPTPHIVADYERLAGSRHHLPCLTYHEGLLDVLVHTQDIAIPLGLRHEMPAEAARHCTARVWRVGFPFYARRNLAGYRLVASDCDWSIGEGAIVQGPVSALLLLVTGRPAGLERLSSPGLADLKRQIDVAA